MPRVFSLSQRTLIALSLTAAPLLSSAQEWPARPVTLVVGFTPGGGADFVARVLGSAMAKTLGQSVLVENRPGAGSSIAAGYVARSAPDGYTALIASPSAIQVNPLIMPKLGYSPQRDLAPVTRLVETPLIIAANPKLGVKTLSELVALAKKEPGKLSFASSGVGSASHLAGQQFQEVAGVQLLHVPYRGGAPAAQAIASGDADIAFASPPSIMSLLDAGRVTGLAVTSEGRLPFVPKLPGMNEAGMPAYKLPMWYGLFVPALTPVDVRNRLLAAAKIALEMPEVVTALAGDGNQVVLSSSPEEFASFLAEDAGFWAQLVKSADIRIE